jgi:hypothetical protein
LTTRWRSIPELFPANYRGIVDICAPEQIAEVLIGALTGETAEAFRAIFLRQFNLEQHLAALAEAFRSVEAADFPIANPTVPARQPAANLPHSR